MIQIRWTMVLRCTKLLITLILFCIFLLWITGSPKYKFTQKLIGIKETGISLMKHAFAPELITIPRERLVHLDLKGAPPKISFLKQFIGVIKKMGATGLLMEYEDMFPFEGNLSALSAKNAYKRWELKNFLESCAELDLKVIPLVQTFGHMEYALKLQEFAHLREGPSSPQALCPNHKESMEFLTSILTQVIEFHLQIPERLRLEHIHIGCDEVFQTARCPLCKGHNKHQLFLRHVENVANIIKTKWPPMKIIIWDDMLQGIAENDLKMSKLGDLVEPMVWSYSSRIAEIHRPKIWEKYRNVFHTVWGASAFKGASPLPRRIIPPIQRHLDNNRGWLSIIAREQKGFQDGFQGLVLSGWQRYSHFAVLCELLPAGMPSLLLSLATVTTNNSLDISTEQALLNVIDCGKHFQFPSLIPYQVSEYHPMFLECSYLGQESYNYLLNLSDYIEKIQEYLQRLQVKDPYFTQYNVQHNFSLPSRIEEAIEKCRGYIYDLQQQARMGHRLLSYIFDEFTIGEFIEQQIYSVMIPLQDYLDQAKMLSKPRHWPQRPFKIPKAVKELY